MSLPPTVRLHQLINRTTSYLLLCTRQLRVGLRRNGRRAEVLKPIVADPHPNLHLSSNVLFHLYFRLLFGHYFESKQLFHHFKEVLKKEEFVEVPDLL